MERNLLSGQFIVFQSPDHTFYIIRVDLLGRFRILLCQKLMKVFSALFPGQFFQFCPHRRFLRILGKVNVLDYCLDIKSGSSRKNRNLSFRVDLFHSFFGHFLETDHMEFLAGFQNINEVMRNPFHFFLCDLGRSDIHMLIYLHGICGDDLPVCRFCQSNGKTGFSHRCRACQYD